MRAPSIPYSAAYLVWLLAIISSRAEAPASLAPLTVSATRSGDADAFSTPYAVTLLPERALVERLTRTLPEALAQTPGVMVQKSGNGQGSPYLRGFTGYRTLTMIDGVRYNNSIYRDGPNEYFSLIDSQALAGIELVQGPTSVLHGSDAIGGTLCLRTRTAEARAVPDGSEFTHGRMYYLGSTGDAGNLGRFDLDTGVGGRWGLHIGASAKEFGDVKAADFGRQPWTGYDEWAWDTRLDARLGPGWSLTAVFQQLARDDAWRTHATVFGVSFEGTTLGDDLRRSKDHHRTLAYLKLRGEDPWPGIDEAVFTASWQRWHEEGTRIRSNRRAEIEDLVSQMWGIDMQLASETRAGRLTYGIDYYEDHVDSARTDYNADGSVARIHIQGPVGDDTVYGMLGVFAQDEVALAERTALTVGARYNLVRAVIGRYADPLTNSAASLADEWRDLIGSLRLTHDLDASGSTKTYMGLSQAFRAPNTADLTRFGASRSSEIETAATGLEPERFLTLETGIKIETTAFSGGLSLFNTWLDDYITSTPTGRVIDGQTEVSKRNSAEGWVRGIEVWGEWHPHQTLRVFGNLTWLDGEADAYPDPSTGIAVREPLSRLQPLTVTLGARWTHPADRWWVELSGTLAADADHLNTADRADTQRIPPGGTPGYTLIHLRAGWQATNHLAIYGGLENLLDEAYRIHGSGSNEAGFGVSLGVEATF